MNYQEMSDIDISRAVGDIFKKDWANLGNYYNPLYFWRKGELEVFDPCNSWADAGPIIQENGIGINRDEDDKAWCAGDFYPDVRLGTWDTYKCSHYHKNPLRAAMIVFLIMKGGD